MFERNFSSGSISSNPKPIKAIAFLVYSNLWVALCTAVLSLGAGLHLHMIPVPEFVFFSTLFVYTGQRFYKIKKGHVHIETERIKWMKEHEGIVKFLLIVSFIGILYQLSSVLHFDVENFNSKSILWFRLYLLVFCAFICFLYVFRIGNKNLREVPYIKIILVSTVCLLVCAVLPFTHFASFQFFAKYEFFRTSVYLLVLFLYIFGVALLFDIADARIDPESQKTIPQVLGIKRSTILSFSLLVPMFVYLYFDGNRYFTVLAIIGLLAFAIGYFFFRSKEFYLAVFGDGLLGGLGIIQLLVMTELGK